MEVRWTSRGGKECASFETGCRVSVPSCYLYFSFLGNWALDKARPSNMPIWNWYIFFLVRTANLEQVHIYIFFFSEDCQFGTGTYIYFFFVRTALIL